MSRSPFRAAAVAVAAVALVASPLAAVAAPPTTPDPPTYDSFSAIADPGRTASGYFAPYWFDDTGTHIQAHGGQVVAAEEDGAPVYYWYGEDRSNGYYDSPGVAVYKSYDALNWTNEGVALRSVTQKADLESEYFDDVYDTVDESGVVDQDRVDELYYHLNVENTAADGSSQLNAIFERPKVLYNEANDTWVMWWHSDGSITPGGSNYARSLAAVAVSDSPTGPFKLTGAYRLYNEPDYKTACSQPGAVPGGARDMTVFQDVDGTAYVSYSSEENRTLYIAKLNADYTNVEKTTTDDTIGFQFSDDGTYPRIFADGTEGAPVDGVDYTIVKRCGILEAPAIFTHDGHYFLVASGATGWDPNPGTYYTASNLLGDWIRGIVPNDAHENTNYAQIPAGGDGLLSVGDSRNTTFGSQPTNVFPLNAAEGKYVYMGDRWNSGAANSTYVWLPIVIGENGKLEMRNPATEDGGRWAAGWTEEYWDTRGAGPYLWSVTDARLPEGIKANTDLTTVLPTTVTTKVNGEDRETAVTWNRTSFPAAGTQTIVGTLAGDADFTPGRTFTRTVAVEAFGSVNIAPQSTVTASSRQDLAARLIDGSSAKGWDNWVSGGAHPLSSTLAFRWTEPRVVNSVVVRTFKDGSSATWPANVGVSYRDAAGAWVKSSVKTTVAQNNASPAPVIELDVSTLPPTTELRVDLSTTTVIWASIAEVEIYGYVPGAASVLTGLQVGGQPVADFSPTRSDYTVGKTSAALPTVSATAGAGREVQVRQATLEQPWASVVVKSIEDGVVASARGYRISFTETAQSCLAVASPWRAATFGTIATTYCDDGAGAFRITDSNDGAWTAKDNLSVVSQADRIAVGDSIETRVEAIVPGNNSDPRAGLVLRNNLTTAGKGTSLGYTLLVTSPTGVYLQSDTNGNGFIDAQSATVAAGTAPVSLKLERTTATTVTGFYRTTASGEWLTVGTIALVGAEDVVDAGVFTSGNNGAGPATATFSGTAFSNDVVVSPIAGTTTVIGRCLAAKVTLGVTVLNESEEAVTYTFRSTYGTKTIAGVEPGKNAYHAFTTRLGTLPTGSVTIDAHLTSDPSVTLTDTVDYAAKGC